MLKESSNALGFHGKSSSFCFWTWIECKYSSFPIGKVESFSLSRISSTKFDKIKLFCLSQIIEDCIDTCKRGSARCAPACRSTTSICEHIRIVDRKTALFATRQQRGKDCKRIASAPEGRTTQESFPRREIPLHKRSSVGKLTGEGLGICDFPIQTFFNTNYYILVEERQYLRAISGESHSFTNIPTVCLRVVILSFNIDVILKSFQYKWAMLAFLFAVFQVLLDIACFSKAFIWQQGAVGKFNYC